MRALFLDRDGVLDDLVYHQDTGGWEAPRLPAEVQLRPGVVEALRRAAEADWAIFVVSNQPDAAKGNTTRDALDRVHAEVLKQLGDAPIREFFYCFHRAEDRCLCRKPQPYFVLEAAKQYGIDLGQSWFVGDTDADVECGRRAGCRTALLQYPHSGSKQGKERPDLVCRDLDHFVRSLLER